ncbi:MAG TPA: calcium/proton exchanger [Terriglobia bacterium]|nr:calcium/proton exchanger [Terriglobia bacterium]
MLSGTNWLYWLLGFFPIVVALELAHASPVVIFATSCLAVLPLAGLMGRATEQLADRCGPGVGGLLNATFGNAAELIIAILALQRGLGDVVKASITGSIIGNILLVLGLSVLAGGVKYKRQTFNRTAAGLGSTLLALSVIGLLVPAFYHHVAREAFSQGNISQAQEVRWEHELSLEISVVLFLVYALSLVFSLVTHRDTLLDKPENPDSQHNQKNWSIGKAVGILLGAAAGVALMSEFLVGAVEATAKALGLTRVFVGVVIVAVIGNAAEHSTAVLMALKNKMDLCMNIAIGSSIQVALFVAPLLVFLSYLFGSPMDLRFTLFEVLSVTLSAVVINLVAQDGESHWMEGVLLLAVYLILGIAFYLLPSS